MYSVPITDNWLFKIDIDNLPTFVKEKEKSKILKRDFLEEPCTSDEIQKFEYICLNLNFILTNFIYYAPYFF